MREHFKFLYSQYQSQIFILIHYMPIVIPLEISCVQRPDRHKKYKRTAGILISLPLPISSSSIINSSYLK
ncbi:hypothetical protein GLOIN_2v1519154 [Rhizophagus irregularis DAOM 181602=DAOM 197198]|uniref:Uncharacterized protein n=1 Tax=Rhizophagus irregularis (strain DAOM 181602 / DAOM 197198 / MUCL 43194) TaxID=747089 RepID=A0A2P4QR96_RHIID|nr:hypothetical protein GLOIN_2v1519154 [Rhizophagus irregularis DAOM 181602=DAOM 197198]POG80179.1 hypothetical protein GLOIN_2v1519154 [Rhizophagus irregularis DAOM 181602=DAOM 197198]|eukprot:XP_025187045.1 hypothetical protein GLOIN_2v1519154 [Rhizophagus irregularis DAOM 181602=DAOM 197198]